MLPVCTAMAFNAISTKLSGKMEKNDWYRKTSWSSEDEKDFFAYLQRARSSYNKAQYLRIQAYYLQRECSPPNYQAALALLEHLIAHYPDPNEIGSAYLQKAKCLEELGQWDEALQVYRQALAAGKNAQGFFTTDVPTHFALFVARHGYKTCYEEALRHIKDAEVVLLLPQSQWQVLAAMAIMAAGTGRKRKAVELARKALAIDIEHERQGDAPEAAIRQRLQQIVRTGTGKWWPFRRLSKGG